MGITESIGRRNTIRFNNALPVPGTDLTFVPTPKNASSAIIEALCRKWPELYKDICHVDRLSTPCAVSMWREPTARAWSAYKYICSRLPLPWQDFADGLSYFPDTSLPWDEFLYELAQNCYRERLMLPLIPQNEFCKGRAKHIMVPWDFERLAQILTVPAILHSNAGKDPRPMPDVTPEMQFHLDIVYGADYRLWEMLTPLK